MILDSTWQVLQAKCPKCNALKLDKLVVHIDEKEWVLAYRCERCIGTLFDGEEIDIGGRKQLSLKERNHSSKSFEDRYTGNQYTVDLLQLSLTTVAV